MTGSWDDDEGVDEGYGTIGRDGVVSCWTLSSLVFKAVEGEDEIEGSRVERGECKKRCVGMDNEGFEGIEAQYSRFVVPTFVCLQVGSNVLLVD